VVSSERSGYCSAVGFVVSSDARVCNAHFFRDAHAVMLKGKTVRKLDTVGLVMSLMSKLLPRLRQCRGKYDDGGGVSSGLQQGS
jgi:hypothetical protein